MAQARRTEKKATSRKRSKKAPKQWGLFIGSITIRYCTGYAI